MARALAFTPKRSSCWRTTACGGRVRVNVFAGRPTPWSSICRDVQYPEPGKITFLASVALDLDVDYERQRWDEGTRLLASELRGRLRVKLKLWCEAATRTEQGPKQLFPDTIFRLRVVKAECRYDHLVVEHVAGVGGDAARLFGEAAVSCVHQLKPSLERRLLERAEAAIVKAGDTKEVRIGLSRLLGGK